MKRLLIGTTNKFRYNNLKKIIFAVNPQLEVTRGVLNVKEKNNSSLENAEIKAQEYFTKYKLNVLCTDDAIFLDDEKYSPKVMVKRNPNGKEVSNTDLLNYWMKTLRSISLKGSLEKAYVLMTDDKRILKKTLTYCIELKYSDIINYDINPLNNFIFPNGFANPIGTFNSEELNNFRKKQERTLKKLLKQANLL